MNKIDHKNPRFLELMVKHNILYPSTVHHFEEGNNGDVKIVRWDEIQTTSQPSLR